MSPGRCASLGHISEVHPTVTECTLHSLLASVPWQLASAWEECPGACQCLVLVLRAFPVGTVPAVLNHEHLDRQPDAPVLPPSLFAFVPFRLPQMPWKQGPRPAAAQRTESRKQRAEGRGQRSDREQRAGEGPSRSYFLHYFPPVLETLAVTPTRSTFWSPPVWPQMGALRTLGPSVLGLRSEPLHPTVLPASLHLRDITKPRSAEVRPDQPRAESAARGPRRNSPAPHSGDRGGTPGTLVL